MIKKIALTLLVMIHIAAFSFEQALMMSQKGSYRVSAPSARLLFPDGSRILPAQRYFFHSGAFRESFIQIGQVLYGDQVSVSVDTDYTPYVKGSTGQIGQLLYQTAGCNFTLFNNLTSEDIIAPLLDGLTQAFVQELVAQLYDLDGGKYLAIPMGSSLYIQESSHADFFECLDYGTQTFKLIRKSDVVTQQELVELDKTQLRTRIVAQAKKLVNQPYQWGGRSALEKSGFDCAGFIEAAYRSCNQKINCSVDGQFNQSTQIEPHRLQPGDLIFFYQLNGNIKKVCHVIMYTGTMDNLIESCPVNGVVRESKFTGQFKQMIPQCLNDDAFTICNERYYISFRSILK